MINDILGYRFSESDRLFFDANVWLAIYPPPSKPNGHWQNLYTAMLKKVKKAMSDMFIDSTVISEYLNTYTRLVFKQRPLEFIDLTFKEYRIKCSSDYKKAARQAEQNMEEILSLANLHVVDCAISGFDRNVMLFDFGKGCSDWNDLVIVEVCKGGGYSLVTNDGDFKDVTGVTILTHNPKLFAR